ncbi:DNA gyrase [Oscillospiraceae bacterium OttesenSCG-928-G22]|nr:DNA gyrase [Oscillospiraceae bacterium OttesenSCG-928-G22]
MCTTKETRRESHQLVRPRKTAIRTAILAILQGGDHTAREIARALYDMGITQTDERNHASPRLTELVRAGKVRAVGKRPCQYTGRTVAVFAIAPEKIKPFVEGRTT